MTFTKQEVERCVRAAVEDAAPPVWQSRGRHDMPSVGDWAQFNKDVAHGDWKSLRHTKMIPAGVACEVVGFTNNFYGSHVRVKFDGMVYDIGVSNLKRSP